MNLNPQNGAPQGYDQNQPYADAKLPPGRASAPKDQSPLQSAVLAPPNLGPDPTMQGWVNRQPGKQQPIQSQGQPASQFGNLSDPLTWMNLVHDPTQLKAWEHSVSPTMNDQTLNYYAGVIQKQPGANPTEQAGSANYYANKLVHDPTVTGMPTNSTGGISPLAAAIHGRMMQPSPSTASSPSMFNSILQQLLQQAHLV